MRKVEIPEGSSGKWCVKNFTVSGDASYSSFFSYGARSPLPGNYTKLMCGGAVVMSDTPAEMRDHRDAVRNAKGHILINGLGIGMVLINCMDKLEVEKATIIELSQDVIDLVGPYYKELYGDKIEIIQANAMDYKPPKGVRYGMVWHDIWTYICSDNYKQMKTLHRRYGSKTDWQGSWCRDECKRQLSNKGGF